MANMAAVLRTSRRLEGRVAFNSECKITAPGEGHHDDDGVWHPPDNSLVYEGPCGFTPQQAVTRSVESAGQQVEIHPYRMRVPQNTPVERGHVVEITACADEGAIGRFFVVRAVQFSQWQTTRVAGLEEGVA